MRKNNICGPDCSNCVMAEDEFFTNIEQYFHEEKGNNKKVKSLKKRLRKNFEEMNGSLCEICMINWEDNDSDIKPSRKNKRNKEMRKKNYYKKLKNLSVCGRGYPEPVVFVDKKIVKIYYTGASGKRRLYVKQFPIKKSYYKRSYKTGSRYGYFKRLSNKLVRKYPYDIPKGNCYKKIFDYQWAVD